MNTLVSHHRIQSAVCLLLAMLCAASCGKAATASDTTDNPDIQNTENSKPLDRLDELGEHDFGGESFVILDEGGNVNFNTPDDTLAGDVINDTIALRSEIIAERYHLEFEYVRIPNTVDRAAAVRNSVMAGDNEYDLTFSVLPQSIGPLATEGMLADLCSIDALSLDQVWWSPLIYDSCRIGGKMFYSTGDISPISFRSAACYYANETLLNEYKIPKEDLYAHVENGTWTLDVLNSYAGELDRDLNQDNTMYTDDDFFGILNENNNLTAACFMTAAGINLCAIDKDGNLYADLTAEPVINAIEKLSGVISKVSRKDNTSMHTAFKGDRVVFLMHYAASGYTRYRDMESDYLLLPLPKYDEKQPNYRSMMSTWGNAFTAVPTTADTERAGIVMEAMAYWSHENLRSAAYDLALKEKGVRNEKDAVMMDTIFNSMYLDFNSFMEFGGSLTPIADAIFKDKDYLSAAEGIRTKLNAEMKEFAQSWIGS